MGNIQVGAFAQAKGYFTLKSGETVLTKGEVYEILDVDRGNAKIIGDAGKERWVSCKALIPFEMGMFA